MPLFPKQNALERLAFWYGSEIRDADKTMVWLVERVPANHAYIQEIPSSANPVSQAKRSVQMRFHDILPVGRDLVPLQPVTGVLPIDKTLGCVLV